MTSIWTKWSADPFAIALLAVSAIGYVALVKKGRPAFFVVAMFVAAIALVSPIAFLSRGVLFSAHMLQHLLLVLVVPPLVLLSLPHEPPGTETVGWLRSVPTWGLGVGAMWLWHAPTLCDAAARDANVLRAQTISLVAMGGAFFLPIFGPRASQRLGTFGAMAYLFFACIACTILGVAVTFSPVEVCSVFAHPAMNVGIGAKADQEIGGLLMWVPGCLVYTSCILVMYGRYARAESVSRKETA